MHIHGTIARSDKRTHFLHVSCVLVACLINFVVIVLLRTVETKERVKIFGYNFARSNTVTMSTYTCSTLLRKALTPEGVFHFVLQVSLCRKLYLLG